MIGAAIGRDLRFVELTEKQSREQLRESGCPADVAEAVIEYGRNPPPEAHTVSATVEQVTGRRARTFVAGDHAEASR